MLLTHDLGEIDAEDTIVYESETKEIKDKEEQGIRRILSILWWTPSSRQLLPVAKL